MKYEPDGERERGRDATPKSLPATPCKFWRAAENSSISGIGSLYKMVEVISNLHLEDSCIIP